MVRSTIGPMIESGKRSMLLVNDQVWVRNKVKTQVWVRNLIPVMCPVWTQVGGRVRGQIEDQVRFRVWEEIDL